MILEVKNLCVDAFTPSRRRFPLVQGVSFSLKENHCIGILGESGSGKSLTCKAILGLLGEDFEVRGEVCFKGRNLLELPREERERIRQRELCMVIQSPMTAFNPLFTMRNQMLETLMPALSLEAKEATKLILESFEKVNLREGEEILEKYPHQLSGGMLQRIMIALCIALSPAVIIADEPTTAIDVANQVEVLKEFRRIRELFGTSMIFISHDLSVLSQIADELLVMCQGEVIERGTPKEIIVNPTHKTSQELIGRRLQLIKIFQECLGERPCF